MFGCKPVYIEIKFRGSSDQYEWNGGGNMRRLSIKVFFMIMEVYWLEEFVLVLWHLWPGILKSRS